MRVRNIGTDGVVWLAVRASDLGNLYFVTLSPVTPVTLVREIDYFPTDLGVTTDIPSMVAGEWYELGISAKGSTLTVYRNGEVILTARDRALAAGKFMLGATQGPFQFDDVLVTKPE